MYLPPTYLVEGAVVWPRVFLGHPPWKIWGLWVFHEFKYECLISENKQKFQRVRRKLQKVKLTCARLKIYKTLYYISWSTQHRHTYTHIFNIYVIYITHTHTHLSIAVVLLLNCVWFFAMPWTLIHQTPPSMGFPRQEYWRGLPFSFPGFSPYPGIELASPALAGGFFSVEAPYIELKPQVKVKVAQSVWLFATPWTIHFMPRQEYWSG